MKAGLKTEAAQLYRKVYNLDISSESKTAAALGAGRCFSAIEDHESVAKWLTRYVRLAAGRRVQTDKNLYLAYYLLGKSCLALQQPKQACDAFQYALIGQLDNAEYLEIISALVEAHIQQQNMVEALDILENVRSWQFSLNEFTEILLLKAKVFREMGLIDKAVAALGDRAQYLPDSQLRAKTSLELTKCYVAKGNLGLAHDLLNKTRLLVEPGPLADQIALELASICLELDQSHQTILICEQLLDLGPPERTKLKAFSLKAAAHKQLKDYEKATLALLGQYDRAGALNEAALPDKPATQSNFLNQAGRLTQ
jgi:tetratricopeptide (TPR) repeat protein